jgi:predicted nucleic acid-binding protein
MSFMIAFDTNILIYCCDKANAQRQRVALDLVAAFADGVLLWQVACEFIAASRKLAEQGFTPEHAWRRLADFLDLFPLILPAGNALSEAQTLHTRNGWAFWDTMIVSSCLEAGVSVLYSEDLPGNRAPEPLRIVNPFV